MNISSMIVGKSLYLQAGQEPEICRNLMGSGAKRRECGDNISVNFSRVRLRSDWIGVIEPRKPSDEGVKFFDFGMVTIKEG